MSIHLDVILGDGRHFLLKEIQVLVEDVYKQQHWGCVLGLARKCQLLLRGVRDLQSPLEAIQYRIGITDTLLRSRAFSTGGFWLGLPIAVVLFLILSLQRIACCRCGGGPGIAQYLVHTLLHSKVKTGEIQLVCQHTLYRQPVSRVCAVLVAWRAGELSEPLTAPAILHLTKKWEACLRSGLPVEMRARADSTALVSFAEKLRRVACCFVNKCLPRLRGKHKGLL